MISRIGVALWVAVAFAVNGVAAEEEAEAPRLSIGARARIETTSGRSFVGVFSGTDDGRLGVEDGGRVHRIASNDVRRVQISSGRKRNAKRGAVMGAAVGLAFGLLLATFADLDCIEVDDPPSTHCRNYVPMPLVTGTLIGTGVGALVQSDRWTDATWAPVLARGGERRGVKVSFHVRF